jgi:thioredoxin 1
VQKSDLGPGAVNRRIRWTMCTGPLVDAPTEHPVGDLDRYALGTAFVSSGRALCRHELTDGHAAQLEAGRRAARPGHADRPTGPARHTARGMMGMECRNVRSGDSMAKRVHRPREDTEFDFILRMSPVPVLAYFTGTWPKAIEPCRVMDDVVGGIADDYTGRLTAVRTDISRCPAATERYGITGALSYVLLKEGEAVARGTGPMTMAEVRTFLDGHL